MTTGGRLIDISPPVSTRSEVWPGDTPFSHRRVMDKCEGSSCNVTTITTTVHVGAHADAPLHFSDGGADAASVPLDAYVGLARVARVPRKGAVTREDVEALDLAGVERLLLRTRFDGAPSRFSDPFAHLEPEAAELLAARGLRLVGIDTFSVDHRDSKDLRSHHALLRGGVAILEGLDLSRVAPGEYELLALPLRLVGVDASPVRAVLRELPRVGLKRGLPKRQAPPVARADTGQAAGDDEAQPDAPLVRPMADVDEGSEDDERSVTMRRIPGDEMHRNYLMTTIELGRGESVRVTLDHPANVMLVDDRNLAGYASGKDFEYCGGYSAESPVELTPPKAGRWNVIIDTGEATTAVAASVRVVGNA